MKEAVLIDFETASFYYVKIRHELTWYNPFLNPKLHLVNNSYDSIRFSPNFGEMNRKV